MDIIKILQTKINTPVEDQYDHFNNGFEAGRLMAYKEILDLLQPIRVYSNTQRYTMDNKPELWKITYYPITMDNKTKEVYDEPRALIERPIPNGIDLREVPLRYLTLV